MKSRHKADHGSDIRQILVGLGFTFFKLVKHIFMGRLVTHHASVLYNNVGFHTHYYFFSWSACSYSKSCYIHPFSFKCLCHILIQCSHSFMCVWMSMGLCVCVWCVTTAIFFSSPNILSFHSYVRRTLYPFITISHVHKTEDINITKYSVFILSSKVLSVSVCACVCVCSHRKAFSFHPWNKLIL